MGGRQLSYNLAGVVKEEIKLARMHSAEREEKICHLRHQGFFYHEIALIVGVAKRTVVQVCKAAGLNKIRCHKWLNDPEFVKAIMDPTISYARIGQKYNLSRQRIQVLAKEIGVTRRRSGENAE